jgi:hypothetical protein
VLDEVVRHVVALVQSSTSFPSLKAFVPTMDR